MAHQSPAKYHWRDAALPGVVQTLHSTSNSTAASKHVMMLIDSLTWTWVAAHCCWAHDLAVCIFKTSTSSCKCPEIPQQVLEGHSYGFTWSAIPRRQLRAGLTWCWNEPGGDRAGKCWKILCGLRSLSY